MATYHHLVNVMRDYIGRRAGITALCLAARMQMPVRQVRRLVSEARQSGIAICGHPRTGYYMAATAADLEETCQFLRSRALHSLALESRLRQVPLQDLIGQLRLPT